MVGNAGRDNPAGSEGRNFRENASESAYKALETEALIDHLAPGEERRQRGFRFLGRLLNHGGPFSDAPPARYRLDRSGRLLGLHGKTLTIKHRRLAWPLAFKQASADLRR